MAMLLTLGFAALTHLAGPAHTQSADGPYGSRLGQQYSDLQAAWVALGRLRDDRYPGDAPVDAGTLSRNFTEIALGREYNGANGGWLVRWRDPIRMHVVFGPSVPIADQTADRAMIGRYASRLSSITGHDIRLTRERVNFLVLVVAEPELRGLRGFLRQHVPELSTRAVNIITRMPQAHLCMVITLPHAARDQGIARAVAIVRAEHPALMRRSCVEEELAQGMGLPNDHRGARPSIFNDDEEFGVLTGHDELLLRMLYDPRLAPGMTLHQISPLLPQIIGDHL
ncbi:DUF2927 domain-containing protein [Jannaschia sp. CCS1]|uniref:DUF2927 domain-containing protein n=1 Tax=Jannaschia sp. (strain CCS1) TaxID=290400 RepID=UPI00030E2E35|nr:DUF2927 domain-containing protein [Jannaschia sp. CCS1]